jgi:hypothetical protein
MRVSDIRPGNGHYRGGSEEMLEDASRKQAVNSTRIADNYAT